MVLLSKVGPVSPTTEIQSGAVLVETDLIMPRAYGIENGQIGAVRSTRR